MIEQRLAEHTPSTLFGVLHSRSSDGWTAEMVPGPWMTDASGRVLGGSVGVLVDVGLSMPVFMAGWNDGVAPVTTSVSLDFISGADWFDGPLTVRSALVQSNAQRGLSRGEILNGSGAVVVVGTLAGRYLPAPDALPYTREAGPLLADPSISLAEILGGAPTPTHDGATLPVMPRGWSSNPNNAMHGGVLMALVDWIGVAALDRGSQAWELASMRIRYLRPATLGVPLDGRAVRVHEGKEAGAVRVALLRADGKPVVTADLGYLRRHERRDRAAWADD